MRKRSSKGGGAQRSIQVHLMVDEEEAAMIRAAARKRNQTVSLTIIEAVKLLEGSLYVEEEEHDSPTSPVEARWPSPGEVAGTPPGRGADPSGARLAPTEWPLGRARLR